MSLLTVCLLFLLCISAAVRIPMKLSSFEGSTETSLDIEDDDDQAQIAEKIDLFCAVNAIARSYCMMICQRVQAEITRPNSTRYVNHLMVSEKSYFAMCAIAKDEHLDIREWILYHRALGCSKFYIYDHMSSPPMLDVILDFVREGLVEYTYVSQYPAQLETFQRCIGNHGRKHEFIAFLDIDEFIMIQNAVLSIPDILKEYVAYGGLVLNWLMFGSSGHDRRPAGGVLDNYHNCAPHQDRNVKTIVHTGLTPAFSASNVHYFFYPPPYYAANTEKGRVDWWTNPSDGAYDIMFINHYMLKSREDYAMKVSRGTADGGNSRTWEEFDRIDADAKFNCSVDISSRNLTRYILTGEDARLQEV